MLWKAVCLLIYILVSCRKIPSQKTSNAWFRYLNTVAQPTWHIKINHHTGEDAEFAYNFDSNNGMSVWITKWCIWLNSFFSEFWEPTSAFAVKKAWSCTQDETQGLLPKDQKKIGNCLFEENHNASKDSCILKEECNHLHQPYPYRGPVGCSGTFSGIMKRSWGSLSFGFEY